jgi:hypothetical protein
MITDRNKYTMPKGNMRGKPGENWMDCRDCERIVGNGRFKGEVLSAAVGKLAG